MQEKNIVLIGFMGTGKSAIGRAISRRLKALHIDTDHEVESYKGCKIPQIFATEGEEGFRSAERTVLNNLASRSNTAYKGSFKLVVSTGGGTPLKPDNAGVLKRIGDIVWLTASVDTIVKRVSRNIDQRPLLSGYRDNPAKRVEELLYERNSKYAALADYNVDTSDFTTPDDAAIYIISMLKLAEEK